MNKLIKDNTKPITQARLKELLRYDPETGIFTWRISRGSKKEGSIAGFLLTKYLSVELDKYSYRLHRLAFLYILGRFPLDEVDHINSDRLDNRWENLRECSRSENCSNRTKSKRNQSGIKGIIFENNGYPRYITCVQVNGRRIKKSFSIATYGDKAEEEAIKHIKSLRETVHKQFHNHGEA